MHVHVYNMAHAIYGFDFVSDDDDKLSRIVQHMTEKHVYASP